jgi:5,10-methylenetetrahydrofolate reductase
MGKGPVRNGRGRQFLRVVEVFPLRFNVVGDPAWQLSRRLDRYVDEVRHIRAYADYVVVADVKDASRLQLSTVMSASLLKERARVRALPVINVRDSNRVGVITSIITAFSLGLDGVTLVWGDRYARGEGVRNVYDFKSLAELIRTTKRLSDRAGVDCTVLAPVDLSRLGTKRGIALARGRLAAGADFLLAQPPTTDPGVSVDRDAALLRKSRLMGKVLPGVFPFRSRKDIASVSVRFGWEVPRSLVEIARGGEGRLLEQAAEVARRLKREGFPGVYVSTRGRPELARSILG